MYIVHIPYCMVSDQGLKNPRTGEKKNWRESQLIKSKQSFSATKKLFEIYGINCLLKYGK